MDITQILRDRRIELNISQAKLADHCGFNHKSSISSLETGRRQWQFKDIIKACELMRLNLNIIEQDYCPACNKMTVDYTTKVCIACNTVI